MGAFVDNLSKVGSKPKGVRGVLQCSGAGSTSFGVEDFGDAPS